MRHRATQPRNGHKLRGLRKQGPAVAPLIADLRYKVRVNGKTVFTAGLPGTSLMSALLLGVSARRRRPERHLLRIAGANLKTDIHCEWPWQTLKSGDQILIQILGPGQVDLPENVRRIPLPRAKR